MSLHQKTLDISTKISSWAHLNFKLQAHIHHQEDVSSILKEQLRVIGYEGKCINELQHFEHKNLFEQEAFFSSSQTGKRIASFALELNGLNQDYFEEIEGSIKEAYLKVQNDYAKTLILEKSYQHCMDTLYVFKL